jgi:anti-sigma B factor antagonist
VEASGKKGMTGESQGTSVSVVVGTLDQGVVAVRIGGEIDISNVDHVHELVEPVTKLGAEQVVFDLSDLSFIDSSGLALLLSVADKVPAVSVKNPSRSVTRIIEVTGLGERLPIEP